MKHLLFFTCMLAGIINQTDAFCQKKINGIIVDAEGNSLPGVTVIEKGKPVNGTITDVEGYFSLSVNTKSKLVISFVGFSTEEIKTPRESNFTLMLDENGEIKKVYWCCTSHNVPHCNSAKEDLADTHNSDETYKIIRSHE